MNKKLYLKKLDTVEGFDVWMIDGRSVRENFEKNFTNFGQFYKYSFIPRNELWLDKENVPGEDKYYISNLLVERRLMSGGMDYIKAHEIACLAEKEQRNESELMKGVKKIREKEVLEKIRKEKISLGIDNIFAWIVNGEMVRGQYFIDFTMGGHDKVYNFVPENELWVDDDVLPKERDYILLHELHERNLMARGLDYAKAHESANDVEFLCRSQPSLFNKQIEKETDIVASAIEL